MNYERYAGLVSAIGFLLIWAFVAWIGVAGPIWRASWTATPSEWLGFAGNLVGGLITLLAAAAAWFAVQAQIKEQRRSVESQRRDIANGRLTDHIIAIFNCFTAYERLQYATAEDRVQLFKAFSEVSNSNAVLAVLTDPLMGTDTGAVAQFISSMRTSAAQLSGLNDRADRDGRERVLAALLYQDLTDTIPQRRKAMAQGAVDDLHHLKLIDIDRRRKAINQNPWGQTGTRAG